MILHEITGGFPIYEDEREQIVVYRRKYAGEDILDLEVNGAMETMMYMEETERDRLIFPYMTHFSYAYAVHPAYKKTYLIGGGGFAYPRHYLSRYPEKRIVTAEYSEQIVEVSRRYFGLQELLENPRFSLKVGDGFALLETSKEMYDVIINDAFVGSRSEGRQSEVTSMIYDHLVEGGMYIVNFIGVPKGLKAGGTRKYLKQLKKYFHYVKVVVAEDDRGQFATQNLVIFASDEELV